LLHVFSFYFIFCLINGQIGGRSPSGTLRQLSIPVEPSHETEHDDKVTVKLASPVQQTIDQTKDEVERENMKQGIKIKRSLGCAF
jgi:hypothetical protein